MKKFLIAAAGLAVAASAFAPALANPEKYDNPCSTREPTKAGSTQTYGDVPPTGNGATGVRGANGYLGMEGNAATANGGIHGATANKEFYGSISNNENPNKNGRICVGSGSTSQTVEF